MGVAALICLSRTMLCHVHILLRYSSAANVTRRDTQRRLFLLILAWLVAVGSVSVAIALVVILWYLYHP